MNTSAKGRKNEHRGRDFFKSIGFTVIRSAGSFGVADLVCFGNGKILFINGKTNMWAPPTERSELAGLVQEVYESGLECNGVLMRFDDGDTQPKFKVIKNGEWIKIDGVEKEVFFGTKNGENNRRKNKNPKIVKISAGKT